MTLGVVVIGDEPMSEPGQIVKGLDAFREQLSAQLAFEGDVALGHEHVLHFCLALGFQSALQLPPGSFVFERTIGRARIDLWLRPLDLIIEVKFMRPIPSGRSRAITQNVGGFLADFNKLARIPARDRIVVLVADDVAVQHLYHVYRELLPLQVGIRSLLLPTFLDRLALTAATAATADGAWHPLRCELIWRASCETWEMFAWSVAPELAALPELDQAR